MDSKNVNFTFAPFSVLIVPQASAVLCLFYQWIEYLVLFLVPFDGFILIHMSHFVNTNFVFSCYFSVLFSP